MGAFRSEIELAVGVFPVGLGRNGLDRVPMFGNLAVLNSEQIVEGHMLAGELTLGFSEPTNFVKFFRRMAGDTPQRDRRG